MAGENTGAAPAAAPTTPAAPTPGSPEYNAAMAAKFDAATANAKGGDPASPAAPETRPAWLPEKFKSPEDLAKAYAEMEKKQGSSNAPATDPAKPNDLSIPSQADATAAAAKAGFDMDALTTEFTENGDLKPETYQKLDAQGIPKAMVDAYVAGQRALAAQYDSAVLGEAGGQDSYQKMVEWARTGLDAAAQQAFNAAVTSGNLAQAKLAVAGLKAQFAAQHGSLPNLVGGGSAPSEHGYASIEQMKADMRKPEYRSDPAFRAQVERKVGLSNLWGERTVRTTR